MAFRHGRETTQQDTDLTRHGARSPRRPLDEPPSQPSARSRSGLDWFAFFVADVQTGFGPFISVVLIDAKWTQRDIGTVLSVGTLVGMVGQIPGGALVDRARAERKIASAGIALLGVSALLVALHPIYVAVLASQILHALAGCILVPSIAAISLGLVGHARLGDRLGRNARFAAVGNGVTALVMGAYGYLFSPRAVFYLTAALCVPTVASLLRIRPGEINPTRAHAGVRPPKSSFARDLFALLSNRLVVVFALCMALFHLANTAMLPLLGAELTETRPERATILVAACIVVPQLVVAGLSPTVGRMAEGYGRRPILLVGFGALALRGLLFGLLSNPYALVASQCFDGVSAAVMGVLVPLILADLTRGTGRFNLAQGVVGVALGLGASASTALGGLLRDEYGRRPAYFTLAGLACLGLLFATLFLRETRPEE